MMWPTLRSLRFALSAFAHRAAPSSPPRAITPARPRLEILEDRCLLAAPFLAYSSFLPATTYAMAVDSAGDTYTAGQSSNGLASVTRLNASGNAAVYATTSLGGGLACGIALDSSCDAFVTGYTSSSTYFTTPGAPFPAFPGGATQAGFLAELSPTGSILYSTYIPGLSLSDPFQGADQAAVAVSSTGQVYVTGSAGAALPTTPGAYQATHTDSNTTAYLAEFDPSLSGPGSLLYCTYLSGTGTDIGTAVAVDSTGNAYVAGMTNSKDFPTTQGAYQATYQGGYDAFVAKVNPTLSGTASLAYGTYLGGSGNDGMQGAALTPNGATSYLFAPTGPGIAVDAAGNAYVTGCTRSADFPVTPGAYETSSGIVAGSTGGVAFVSKLNATGSALVYSTFLGTPNAIGAHLWARDTQGTRIAVDAAGDAYVTGMTGSTSFPLVNAVQGQYGGNGDAFVTEFNPAGSALLYSSYLGGSESDVGLGIGLDANNNPYVAGITLSANYPVTSGAYTVSLPQKFSGFVAKVVPQPTGSCSVTGMPASITAGQSGSLSVMACDASDNVMTGYCGTVHFSSSDPHAILPADYTFTTTDQGVHNFTVTLETAGSQSITVTDAANGYSGSEGGVTVTPAAAAVLVLSAPASVSHGAAFSVTLTVQDAYGNVVTGYIGTVHFTSSDSTATLPKDYTFTASDAGVHTFSSAVTLRKKGTQTLTVSDTLNSGLKVTDSISVT
jgi:hypothetical protein